MNYRDVKNYREIKFMNKKYIITQEELDSIEAVRVALWEGVDERGKMTETYPWLSRYTGALWGVVHKRRKEVEEMDVTGRFHVHDISCESLRIYMYPEGDLVIENPVTLFIDKDNSGKHRVQDASGLVTYMTEGWISIQWMPKDKSKPLAF